MERIREEKEEHSAIGGDYNARTGNEGRSVREEEERDNERRRKDISKQNRRKRLDDSERKLGTRKESGRTSAGDRSFGNRLRDSE